jgi:putative ABC transport system permease protein
MKLLRNSILRNNKGYNELNIFGLAIGIACAGLVFLWVQYELSFDDVHVNKARLYQLEVSMAQDGYTFTMGSTPRGMAAAMVAEVPGVVRAARYLDGDTRLLIHTAGKSMYATGRFCDEDIFKMFTFHFTEGDPNHPFPQLYSVVITQSEAKKLFGTDQGVVNKVFRAEANFYGELPSQDYVVSGVVQDPPENSSLQFEYLIPYDIINTYMRAHGGKTPDADWGSYGPFTYVELDAHANLTAVNVQLRDFIHRKSADQKTTTFLYPMNNWRLYDEFANSKETGGGRIRQVRTLSAIAWIILLIACVNFMNLATATAQKRAKEVGVRKVLGVRRRGLVLRFMREAFVMAAAAGLLGVLIIQLALPAFDTLMGVHVALRLTDPLHIGSLLAIVAICGVVAGSYPAFYLSAFNPISVLKGLKMKTGGAPMLRRVLVVVQFAVSVFFILSTLVVWLQIQHIRNRDLGINKDRMIEVNPEHLVDGIFPLIKQELLKTGLVENVALADHQTLYDGETSDQYKWPGKPEGQKVSIARRSVTAEYVSTSGMKIVEGRDFRETDKAGSTGVIINESFAKLLGAGPQAGKVIQTMELDHQHYMNVTVIGVVRDYVYGDVHAGGVSPLILYRRPSEYQNFVYVRPKAQANTALVLAAIAEVLKKNNSGYPPEYKFVDEQFSELFADDTQTSKVSGVFAVLAVLISCLGLFGLATYMAEQRRKEIGIRKVLGASVAGVSGLLTGSFVGLVGVACLIAFPVAWWVMHGWLQGFEYRISMSWWMFGAAGLLALVIAVLTIGSQAVKAAMANPVRSLRSE